MNNISMLSTDTCSRSFQTKQMIEFNMQINIVIIFPAKDIINIDVVDLRWIKDFLVQSKNKISKLIVQWQAFIPSSKTISDLS